MNKKTKMNLIYIAIYLIIAGIGLNNSLGLSRGEFNPPIYYTTLSGLICFLYFLIGFVNAGIKRLKHQEIRDFFIMPRMKGAITICITVTLLVYHFVVYEGPVFSVDTDIFNLITHYIAPLMIISHYFIFDEKGIYHRIDPLIWLVIPTCYFTWANIKAASSAVPYWGDKVYPYSFMDLTKHSLNQVIITVGALFIFFILLGYGLYAIDATLGKRAKAQA